MPSQRNHNTQKRLEISFLNRLDTDLYQSLVFEHDWKIFGASLRQSGIVGKVREKEHVADYGVLHVENTFRNTK